MKERPADMERERGPQVAANAKRRERRPMQNGPVSVTKSESVPNPLKGLQLSLYPIVKEH